MCNVNRVFLVAIHITSNELRLAINTKLRSYKSIFSLVLIFHFTLLVIAY